MFKIEFFRFSSPAQAEAEGIEEMELGEFLPGYEQEEFADHDAAEKYIFDNAQEGAASGSTQTDDYYYMELPGTKVKAFFKIEEY